MGWFSALQMIPLDCLHSVEAGGTYIIDCWVDEERQQQQLLQTNDGATVS